MVTAGIVSFNGEKFIREAIQSILDQSYQNIEIIVVDDGSTDLTAKIASQFHQVKLVTQDNLGEGAARNRILQEATGDYIAYLDDDDCWFPTKIQQQLNAAITYPELDYVFCRIKVQAEEGFQQADWALAEKTESVGSFFPSALFAPRKTFEKVGTFQPELKMGADFEWFTRAIDLKLKSYIVEEPLVLRRIHSGNAVQDNERLRKVIMQTMRTSIRRKRNEQ
ncbi:MAG: glycosyltransferase [Verrucomicrobiota bacterium]